jgi:hypothetical protein
MDAEQRRMQHEADQRSENGLPRTPPAQPTSAPQITDNPFAAQQAAPMAPPAMPPVDQVTGPTSQPTQPQQPPAPPKPFDEQAEANVKQRMAMAGFAKDREPPAAAVTAEYNRLRDQWHQDVRNVAMPQPSQQPQVAQAPQQPNAPMTQQQMSEALGNAMGYLKDLLGKIGGASQPPQVAMAPSQQPMSAVQRAIQAARGGDVLAQEALRKRGISWQ